MVYQTVSLLVSSCVDYSLGNLSYQVIVDSADKAYMEIFRQGEKRLEMWNSNTSV